MTKSLDVLGELMADEEEVEAWRDRADDLHATTTLSRRQAEVWALKELGYEHAEIAEIIGSSHSAVDNYSSDVRRKREVAERTVEALAVEEEDDDEDDDEDEGEDGSDEDDADDSDAEVEEVSA